MLNSIHLPVEESTVLSSNNLNQGFKKLFHLHYVFLMQKH